MTLSVFRSEEKYLMTFLVYYGLHNSYEFLWLVGLFKWHNSKLIHIFVGSVLKNQF